MDTIFQEGKTMDEMKKFMLPVTILNLLSENFGEMKADELVKRAGNDDPDYVMETLKDMAKEEYIAIKGDEIILAKSRVIARW